MRCSKNSQSTSIMLIALLVAVISGAMLLGGCVGKSAPGSTDQFGAPAGTLDSRFQYADPLSLTDVKTALTSVGLQLNDNQEDSPVDYKINDVTPVIYSVDFSNQIILVYIFPTIEERKEVLWSGDLTGLTSVNIPPKDDALTRTYAALNVLVIDMLDVSMMNNIPEIESVLQHVKKAARTLNDSQEIVFADQGAYWEARYTVDYYQHWYKDDKGLTLVDQNSNGKWEVKYIGPKPESIENIKYEYQTMGRGGSGDGIIEKSGDDHYLRIGSGGSDSIPDKDSVCTLKILWNGHEESLNLKNVLDLTPQVKH